MADHLSSEAQIAKPHHAQADSGTEALRVHGIGTNKNDIYGPKGPAAVNPETLHLPKMELVQNAPPKKEADSFEPPYYKEMGSKWDTAFKTNDAKTLNGVSAEAAKHLAEQLKSVPESFLSTEKIAAQFTTELNAKIQTDGKGIIAIPEGDKIRVMNAADVSNPKEKEVLAAMAKQFGPEFMHQGGFYQVGDRFYKRLPGTTDVVMPVVRQEQPLFHQGIRG